MKKFTRVQLEVQNVAELAEQTDHKRFADVYRPLVQLLAEVCDLAADGNNIWVTIGKTKDGSALALTVNSDEGRLSGYAGTLGGLSIEAGKLL